MTGVKVRLLVVLIGTLLLDSVWVWERIDKAEFDSWTAELGDALDTSTDDGKDYDDVDDEISENAVPEYEGTNSSDGDFHSFAPHGFPVEGGDSGPRNWVSSTHKLHADPRSRTGGTNPSSAWINVVCSQTDFQITLLTGQLSDVNILGLNDRLPVMEASESCGYHVDHLKNTLTVPFTGCYVKHTDEDYSLQLLYVDNFGQMQVATASCERILKLGPRLFPRSGGEPADCAISPEERLSCGQIGISSLDCELMGCCVDSSSCYYPLDVCTADQQFIFAIHYNTASIPVDPALLIIPGTNCKPVIVNDKVAIFKFKVTECGTHAYEVGETNIYMTEVQTAIRASDLKYGIIARTNPVRFIIECRYSQDATAQQLLASTGYMVMAPSSSMPSAIISNGLYAVQLRIATDETYSSYLPTYHSPLRLLLGNPVYLELSLMSPKPDAVILVNYCLAYPLSAKNALVLIYEGCANPFDPKVSVLKVTDLPENRYQRRFMVSAFQFIKLKTNKYLNEEIYFMCSTEVCRPTEKTCKDQCFDGQAP